MAVYIKRSKCGTISDQDQNSVGLLCDYESFSANQNPSTCILRSKWFKKLMFYRHGTKSIGARLFFKVIVAITIIL